MRTTLYAPALPPHRAETLGPACTAIIETYRSPTMPPNTAYALLPRLAPGAKPCAYPSLRALAARIHRDRAGRALQLLPARVRFRDRDRDVTEVLALDEASGSTARLGFAWVAGGDWRTLQAGLEALAAAASVEG